MSNTSSITALINIGNDAQKVGDKEIANVCTALLLDKVFNGNKPELQLSWVTNEPSGRDRGAFYFDLLAIHHGNDVLYIPIPLLKLSTAVAALKAASLVERTNEDKETAEPQEGSHAAFWDALKEADFQESAARLAVRKYLNPRK